MIVSVHLPKTAGTSFRATLEGHFGTRLREDYGDMPVHQGNSEAHLMSLEAAVSNSVKNFDDVSCIHGHFMPVKYLLLQDRKDIRFVTWMRHPVARVVSHYEFWKRNYNEPTAGRLHKKVIEENWSLRRFCLSEDIRDLYAKLLWAFPLRCFSFIGITEYYEEDHGWFVNQFLHSVAPVARLNTAPSQDYLNDLDKSFIRELEEFHNRDMLLYEAALSLRDKRMNG